MSNPYIPDQLHHMSKKELLEFAQTAHEENVKLVRQLAKANERVVEFDKQRKAIALFVYESSIDELDNEIEIDADVLAEKVFNVIGISAAQLRKEQEND